MQSSGVVLSRDSSGGTQLGAEESDLTGPPNDEWTSTLSRSDVDDAATRAVPVMPSAGASSASKPQFDPPSPPRYDDRPQYAPPPAPPTYGEDFAGGSYAPPRHDHLPVPMGYYSQPAVGFQCPFCRTTQPPISLERVSQTGWIVLALMIIFCFPLFWIGLLIKEPYRVCSQCRNVLS